MKTKNNPSNSRQVQGATVQFAPIVPYKDRVNLLTPYQKRVYNLLLEGGQWSTIELMRKLNIADPRKAIERIRANGLEVSDYWCTGEYGTRYKRYFIRK